MSLRTRLFIFVLLFGSAVLMNIFALVYLARSISFSLKAIEGIRQRQLVAVQMNAHLRDAEAALYSYQINGEAGFKSQFTDQLEKFSSGIDQYQQLATDSNEQQWAITLRTVSKQTNTTGNNLIALRDRQASDLENFLDAQSQLTDLLFNKMDPTHPEDSTLQPIITNMQDASRAILSSVTGYIASPDENKRVQFTDADITFQQALNEYRGKVQTENEKQQADKAAEIFNQIQSLGSQLIGGRDLQQSLYANFISAIFNASQQTIVSQIEPHETEKFAQEQKALLNAVNTATIASISLTAIISAIALLFMSYLSRQINERTTALLEGAKRVSEGDLTEQVEVIGKDELAHIGEAFNNMMTDLVTRERRLKARLSELEALRRVSLQLTSALEPQAVLEVIAESVLNLPVANEVRIYTGAGLTLSVNMNRTQAGSLPTPHPNGIVSLVASTGQMHVANWNEVRSFFNDSFSEGAISVGGLPLKLGEQVLGVLFVASGSRSAFTKEDIRFLNLLADQAAVALGNASLIKNLQDREGQLRELIEKMEHIQYEERRLIGLDLHDGLTQIIFSANMHLNALEIAIRKRVKHQAAQELEISRSLVIQAIEEARRVIAELRPTVIEDFGLEEGLKRYVTEFSENEHWKGEVITHINGLKLPSTVETSIFRIAQEALTNIRKHAQTERVYVELSIDGNDLLLRVQDWGQGFDESLIQRGEAEKLGLVSMKERARMINGICNIESQIGKGTCVEVRLPLIELSHRSKDDP